VLGRALPWVLAVSVAVSVAVALFLAARRPDDATCGPGFVARAARCEVGFACLPPLVVTSLGCDAPDDRVAIPETSVVVGPSDWEAEGRSPPRTIHVHAFRIDAFEATVGKVRGRADDPARAASGLDRDEAIAYCASRGGRLPTADEWLVAAAGKSARRYPWGDTGAVCRRAAWGLASGPCSTRGTGPDTVGAHPDGDTPAGLHDMAGNVAEWVSSPPGETGVACGGSWASGLATELRTWSRLELSPKAKDPRLGVRCAYDPAP
jgi:formylglycine-generating enzyme required for sulfatase activity